MSDIAQGARAKLILNPGDIYRIGTSGVATVVRAYGDAPATTTVTADTQTFGPYSNQTKLIVTANSRRASITPFGASATQTAAAAITGNFVVGQTLTAVPPTGFVVSAYQWTRTLAGTTTNISGATSSTYAVQSADATYTIGCMLTGAVAAAGSVVPSPPVTTTLFPMSATSAFKGKITNNGSGGTFVLNAAGAANTQSVVTVLESHADSFRIWFANNASTAQAGLHCGIRTFGALGAPNTAARNHSSETLVNATFGGAASGTLAAGSGAATTAVWTATDWISCPTVDRTDGGTLPGLQVVLDWPSTFQATTIPGPGSGTAGTTWELDDPLVGNRPWSCRLQAGQFATDATKAGLTSNTTQTQFWPAIIIEYIPRGSVKPRTMMVNYDSFASAPASGINPVNHFGWPEMLQAQYSTLSNPIELVNNACAGSTQDQILAAATSVCSVVKNAVALFPNASGNSGGNTLGAAFVTAARTYNANMRSALSAAGNVPVIATMSPVDPSKTSPAGQRAYGATDSFRVNMNAQDVAASPGTPCADISAACSPASPDGTGQFILMNTDDAYHLNKAGQLLLVPPVAAALKLSAVA